MNFDATKLEMSVFQLTKCAMDTMTVWMEKTKKGVVSYLLRKNRDQQRDKVSFSVDQFVPCSIRILYTDLKKI